MFRSARLQLTAWYLLIIMCISILFSMAIYHGITGEVERSLRVQKLRLFRQNNPSGFFSDSIRTIDPDVLDEAKDRILLSLALLNVSIFVAAGGAGYFLAGRTLRPIQKMVEDQNRFITDASHEFRTPLTSLKSEIEVFLRGKTDIAKDTEELLQSNLEEINNLQMLSDNLLELTQYEKPQGTVAFEIVSILDVVDAAVRRVLPLAKRKQMKIEKKIADLLVKGDKQSLVQLLVILLDNAIKYSEKKKAVTISAKTTDHSVVILVKDEGVGIEEKDIPHIFDRFYRADISRTKQQTLGYGLGLSIAQKIAYRHNGSITVESEKDKGTTFRVQLSRVDVDSK